MHVKSISIRRDGDYGYGRVDPSKPMMATIEVHGQHGKVELALNADMSARIVAIIAEEIAAAGRATAEMLTAQCLEASPVKTPALA